MTKEEMVDWAEKMFARYKGLGHSDSVVIAIEAAKLLSSLNGWNVNINHCMKRPIKERR